MQRCERLLCNGSSSTLFRKKITALIQCCYFLWEEVDSFNSGTGEFTRKVERQRVAVQGDSPRKFICAEDVDGQKNNAIV